MVAAARVPVAFTRRHECARQELGGACVGAVVDACRVSERVVEQRHDRKRRKREGAGERHGAPPPVRAAARGAPDGHEGERPDDVELHDHTEVPQVREGRGKACRLEVRDLAEDVGPVAEEEGPGQGVRLDLGQQARAREVGRERRERNDHEHRGQQAHDASQQVAAIAKASAVKRSHHAARGEKPRDDEKNRDAEKPAREHRGSQVVEHDAGNGERAQPVDGADAVCGRRTCGRRLRVDLGGLVG